MELSREGLVSGSSLTLARHRRFSLHRVVEETENHIVTDDGSWFDSPAYSRFKYGDRVQALAYGRSLAHALLRSDIGRDFGDGRPLTVTASAYKSLFTAAQFVADSVVQALDEAGFSVVPARIHRAQLTEGDYGTMSAEERALWMSRNGLSFNEELFVGSHTIIVDDVRITGSHERAITNLISKVPLASVTSAYVVEIDPDLASRDPRIEDRMNHAFIRTLYDLYGIMQSERHYIFTARTVKFVLSSPPEVLRYFLKRLRDDVVLRICDGVIADGYDKMSTYAEGVQMLLDEAALRETSRKNV